MNPDSILIKKSVLITRRLGSLNPALLQLNALGYEVLHDALVTTSQIRFTHTPATQWIFFPGKDAIKYFFAQKPELKAGVKFGVISETTAEFLFQHGYTADFTGTGVDVVQIGKDFARLIGDDSVLLPQAIDSQQTIQKQLSFTNSCHNLFVYKTSLREDFPESFAELLAFTSPSNVEAYFRKYKLHNGQKVVAVGSTTMAKLREFGIKDGILSSSFDENGLLKAILDALEISNDAIRSAKH